MHVTYEQAEQAIAAAIAESNKLGTQMCIAVVDSGADLKAFVDKTLPVLKGHLTKITAIKDGMK